MAVSPRPKPEGCPRGGRMAKSGAKREKTPQDGEGSLRPTDEHCRPPQPGTPEINPTGHRRSKEGQTMANAPPLRIERRSDAFWMRRLFWMRALRGRGITIEAHHRQAAMTAWFMLNGAGAPQSGGIVVSYPPTEQTRDHRLPDRSRSRPSVHGPRLRPPQVKASHATPRIALAKMTASRSDNIRSSTGGCMTRCHVMGGTHRQLDPRCVSA